MISTRILCQAFVGRAAELEHLNARRRGAGDGHGGLVLIGGEAGIGKSRLVREFTEQLNRRMWAVASSPCREFAQKPLGPILDVLAQLGGPAANAIAGSSKNERLDAIAGGFERIAAKRTAVAIVEDLHWADLDLVQTLIILAQRAASARLLFVATYRDDEIVPDHPLFKWFGQLVREPEVSVVTLRPLQDREIDRLMSFAIGDVIRLSVPVLHEVRERSDGNPLFAEELLRSAVDAHRAGEDRPRALPLSLHAIIGERLKGCSEEERSTLRQASVLGRRFRVDLLAEIFGGESSKLRKILERMCSLQLIDAIDLEQGDYQFRHALTRDVVYSEMPAETVRSLHLTIADHMERTPRSADGPEDLAHHLWEAGCRDRAAAYYEAAGDSAMSIFAYENAAAFYERAAAGLEGDAAASARVCGRAAQSLIFAGELDAGVALYERTVKLALDLGDLDEAVRSRALMAGHMFDGGRTAEAITVVRETLPIAERGGHALRTRLLTRLAMMLARDAKLDDAAEALRRIDGDSLDPAAETTGEYHLCASELHALRAERDEWQNSFARGLAIYEARGHPGPIQIAHANFAVQALCIGETAIARTHHQIAAELARTLRFDDQAVLLAQVELFAGNLAEVRRIVGGMTPSRKFFIRAMQAQVVVPLALALGDDQLLDEYLDPALVADAGPKPFTATLARVAAAHAMALAARGRMRDSRSLLGRVIESMHTSFGMALPIVAVATLVPERASELRPIVAAGAKPSGDRVNKALLALLDAVAASNANEKAVAKERAQDGAGRFHEIGWPLYEARCLEVAGEVQSALTMYVHQGAAGDARRLELDAMADEQGAFSLGLLTARERELALHIASGKPNRAAAAALSITEKAVEKYLTSIYAKLGLKSRAQLAAYVAARQHGEENVRAAQAPRSPHD
jgi:DNA-binding CsgD family transcriptional regulator/tetratricopeptide (TPR) repeat protein